MGSWVSAHETADLVTKKCRTTHLFSSTQPKPKRASRSSLGRAGEGISVGTGISCNRRGTVLKGPLRKCFVRCNHQPPREPNRASSFKARLKPSLSISQSQDSRQDSIPGCGMTLCDDGLRPTQNLEQVDSNFKPEGLKTTCIYLPKSLSHVGSPAAAHTTKQPSLPRNSEEQEAPLRRRPGDCAAAHHPKFQDCGLRV